MRRILVLATAASVLALAAPASAATLLAATGTPLSERIMGSSSPDGTTLQFQSKPSNYVVDYSSSDMLHASSTGGFAFVSGATDSGFSDLTITPETVAFSSFKFNLKLPASDGPAIPNGYHTTYTFDAQVFFAGDGSQTFNDVSLGNGAGQNRFVITADAGQAIDKIVFSDLVGVSTRNNRPTLTNDFNFGSLRQTSFNVAAGVSPVPEPATWAMFILGFGLMGTMLRAARKRGTLETA